MQKSLEVKKKCLPLQSQTKNGVHKHSKFGKQTTNKFIEKTETVQEASTEKNTIYREALISLEIRSVRDKLRII